MPSRPRALPIVAALLLALPVEAQENESRWDVTETRGATRTLDFTTDEGTWMSLDLSPDGRWILMDLLGQIWRVPAAGGDAEALTQESGAALNYHPRWSPDGRSIAFVSDRRGQANLWIMDADGGNPRIVKEESDARVLTPAWTPDGQYIIVRREPLGGGGGGGGSQSGLWMYHRDGGSGVQVLDKGSANWPSVSPDGDYIYFHTETGGEALAGDFQLQRLELRNGQVVALTAGGADGAAAGRVSSGGAFAPEVSPDGRWLAFARQLPNGTASFKGHEYGPRTALWLRDLDTGAERILVDPIEFAIESGSKSLRVLPGYAWSADGRSIVLSQGGHIRRVDVAGGTLTSIPFQAHVRRTISEMAYQPFRIEDGPFRAKFLRWPTASPDGRRVAFQAIGRVWTMDLPNGTPRRATPETFGAAQPATDYSGLQEFSPTWSPDGRWIAFTTWQDTAGGAIWRVSAQGGQPERLTAAPGEFVHVTWSPDGTEILAAQGAGATRQGRTLTANTWWDVVRVPAAGGPVTHVARVPMDNPDGSPSNVARRGILQPSWGPEGRIFFPAFRDGNTSLVSVRPDGSDERTHLIFPYADEAVPSPDGRRVAFQEGDNIFVTALPMFGTGVDTVTLEKRRGRLPVKTLSRQGGLFPHWRDSATVEFGSADRYYRHNVLSDDADTFAIALTVPRRTPTRSIAFTNARIVTLGPDSVIERGTLVVDGARITCVGSCDAASADSVIDASGRTLIPGFIDMHSHHYREHRGHRPLRDYEAAIYLAYGVTTSLDNSMWSQNIFPTAEMIEAGRMIGPRTFSTGDPLYRGDDARQNELSSREVVVDNVARLKSWGAVSIKQYLQPRRDQRQWVSDAARDLGAMVTAESGDLFYNLSMVIDGQTGFEHPFSHVPLYGDVAKFLGRAGFHYSPTLVVAGPSAWNIEYWFAESDVWLQPKQLRWMPWRMTTGHLRHRTLRPETDYSFPLIAQGMADIIAEGGYGAIGGHGEHHGPNAHWEVWMGASALGPYGALEVASLHGAKFLGAEQDLGSLEVGKLADILVLDRNPLDDIRATMDIRFVMKGGVLYEGDTLNEVWPGRVPFGPYYWVDDDALRSGDVPIRPGN